MSRPTTLGVVIAERTLVFRRPGRRPATARVQFGKPVCPRGGPWHCAVRITGLGPRRVMAVSGEDSLQSLILALEFVSLSLPTMARRAGGTVDWLDEVERPVFAHTFLLDAYTRAAGRLVGGIQAAVKFIRSDVRARRRGTRPLVRRLEALTRTWGLRLSR